MAAVLLAIDIGNTNITLGVFRGGRLVRRWSTGSLSARTSDEFGVTLRGLFASAGLDISALSATVVCSVVPCLNGVVREALEGYGSGPVRIVGEDIDAGVPMLVENPSEVGADRLVNAAAGFERHKEPLIIVDLGTAVTFDHVTAKGEYAGGVIAPGVGICAEALSQRTAKLPKVEPRRPERVIGRNTVDCIRSGLYWGFAGLIDGVLERMVSELGHRPLVIATGGAARLITGESRFVKEYDPDLTLRGLRIIYEGNI